MAEMSSLDKGNPINEQSKPLFVVTCVSGFETIANARSAFMFAALAAAADFRTILFCTQSGVDLMVKGAIEKNESAKPGAPTLAKRVEEALEMGVEIQCCSQAMDNKKLTAEDLIPAVEVAGAMSLIEIVTNAKGTLCF